MKFNYLTTLALGGVMTLTMAAPVENEVSKPNTALATRDMEEIAKRVPQNKPPSLDQSFCQIQWSIEHTGGGRQLTDEEIKVATETCLACEGQTTC